MNTEKRKYFNMPILYNIFLLLFFLVMLPFIPFVYLFSKKRRANMLERLGFKHLISPKIPGTKRVWIHALSVGEVKSALPLVLFFLETSNF
ncbi:MAG: hypothetical protein HQK67_02730 [Desulfamplus sp.]|nr:hypothetical protein [Desulfamplus sp.]